MSDSQKLEASDFLAGGGEMTKVVRSMDWAQTPLGRIESWPQSLRTTVSLCLASNFPISIAWGPKHTQIYNDGYWPICGAKHPHSMGQDFTECWASAWPVVGEAFERALAGETSYLENQRMFLDRNGYLEETFFTFSFSPIRDETGGVVGLFHPVTEQTSKMLSERRTRALRDLAARAGKAKSIDEVFTLGARTLGEYDLDLPFVLFYLLEDDGARARLVASNGLERGTPASPTIAETNGQKSWPLAEVIRSGAPIQVHELARIFGPVTCGPYPEPVKAAFAIPISAPGAARPLAVFVAGVSTRLPLDEAYKAFFDLLAATVTAVVTNARALEDERRKAEALAELDRAKTAFFSNISHEFRTPLSLMLGPVEDALNDAASTLPAVQRERIEVAQRNALRLLKLVNTLLDFSRIEAGRVHAAFEPVDLAAFTGELASNFRSLCESAGLRFIVDCPPLPEPVHVDPTMWEKIVLNLVSNAFKFTFEGEIAVSLTCVGSGRIELAVRDTGTGIEEKDLPRLFERFHRIEGARGRTYEGSGIGLALVQELTKLHGGALSVESVSGRGSTFRVSIPRGADHLPAEHVRTRKTLSSTDTRASAFVEEARRWLPDAPAAQPPQRVVGDNVPAVARADGERRPVVVLADDNADMRAYLTRVLEEGGYEVRAVADGEAALTSAHEQPEPDLILSDIMMPRLDGFGLLRALRGDSATESLYVILLSARAGEEARVEGLAAGADDYLVKPFSARELRARVDGAVRLVSQRRQAAARERDLKAEILLERGRAALRELEGQVRISQEKYRALMEQANDTILMFDSEGRVLEANRQAEKLFGRARGELIGQALDAFMAPDGNPNLSEVLASQETLRELRLRRRDGGQVTAEVSVAQVSVDGERILMLIARDVTERRQLEQQLRHAQKMEAVGQLTGGVAHDFNNLLTVITGTIELLAAAVAETPELAAMAKNIDEAADRGAQLTRRMLAFARKQPLQPRALDLNETTTRMVGMLRRMLGEDIDVKTMLTDDLWQATADAHQIEDAILNLAVNARDAMPTGGQLVIETDNVHLDEHYAAQNADVMPGDYVSVVMTDSGTGMPPDVVERAFEPFYTTKDVGQGTGLGLSMVYGFVKQSRGHVKIYSEVGHGTSIKLYLPRAAVDAQHRIDSERAKLPEHASARETILLVEDDAAVRTVVINMLRGLGYQVNEAVDAKAALGILDGRERIDLLFTDMVMPGGMSGSELARAARERRPGLKVLFTSGYSGAVLKERGQADADIALLSKPYRAHKLAEAVRAVLDNGLAARPVAAQS